MWIFDSYYKGCVELWGREQGLTKASSTYPPSFYMHLKDPPAHREMIEALESRFKAEECSFRTIFGTFQGHRIYASRKVAEKIEIQTRYAAELYNVDIRQDQRYLAEHDLFPCGDRDESRFSPDFEIPLTSLELQVSGDPSMPREISRIEVLDGCKRLLEGPERQVLSDLLELIKAHDPDLILCPHADNWIPLIVRKAERYGLETTFSRTGFFKPMASKSYWSYGKVNHKEGAMIPEGRILIDTAKSFVYAESGLKGVLMASRLSGLSPNLTSRFTPGTLISSYEVFEALRRGVAVPFRKRDAEGLRNISELMACDKGGMMFQPEPELIEPAIAEIPDSIKKLILLLSGDLLLLPIHAALIGVDRLLCDRFCISYAPSVPLLIEMREKAKERAGDDLYEVIYPSEDLIFGTCQGETIAKLFQDSRVDEGLNGTREAVLNGISGRAYIHFFCHGYYSWNDPPQSYLILANNSRLTLSARRTAMVCSCQQEWLHSPHVRQE